MMFQAKYPVLQRLAYLLIALGFVLTSMPLAHARPASAPTGQDVSQSEQAPGFLRLAQRVNTYRKQGQVPHTPADEYKKPRSRPPPSPGGIGVSIDVLGMFDAISNFNPPPVKKTTPRKKKKKQVTRRTPRRKSTPPVQRIPQFFANEVTVLIGQNQPGSVDDEVARSYGLTILSAFPVSLLDGRIVRYGFSDGRTVPQVIATLTADPRVFAQPNNIYLTVAQKKRAARGPVQYSLDKLGLTRAHKLSQGQGVTIAVIDTGLDVTHPVLANAVSGSFDAVGDGRLKAQNHGTAIAGLIAGQGKVTGAAPRANLLAVRAFYMHPVYRRPVTSSVMLLKALDWSFANKARIINMSFTGPYDPLVKKALERASENDVILVAAAGNGGAKAPPAYPAAYEGVIAITALDHKDRLYAYANRGSYVAIAAPGVDLLVPSLRKGYRYSSGTSLAAAQISGLIALLLERHPQASASAVLAAIVSSAHDLGPKGYDIKFGAGRADAHASLISLANGQ